MLNYLAKEIAIGLDPQCKARKMRRLEILNLLMTNRLIKKKLQLKKKNSILQSPLRVLMDPETQFQGNTSSKY